MSGIALLEHAFGPLAEAYMRLGKAWDPEIKAVQSGVGKFFQGLAEDPGYFQIGKDIPKGQDSEIARLLAKKHEMDPASLVVDSGSLTHRPTGTGISPTGDSPLILSSALQGAADFRRARLMDRLNFAKEAGMGPSSDYMSIDMLGANEGSGMAKKLYPLFTDWLMAHPGTAAINTGLSASNIQKKALYQAAAMEKYGDKARNIMQVDPAQLDSQWGKFHNERQFQKSDTPTQIGALNMAIGNNTSAKIHELMRLTGEELRSAEMGNSDILKSDESFNKLDQAYEAAKRLGLGPSFMPSTGTDFKKVSDTVGDLASQMQLARPVGYDTLRRSGLVNDLLQNPSMDPRDFTGSELTRGLARAKGGRVASPHKLSGPLTRYQCGA